jgi:hypothetical protein
VLRRTWSEEVEYYCFFGVACHLLVKIFLNFGLLCNYHRNLTEIYIKLLLEYFMFIFMLFVSVQKMNAHKNMKIGQGV